MTLFHRMAVWVHRTQPQPACRVTDLRCDLCGEYFDTMAQQVFHHCPEEPS